MENISRRKVFGAIVGAGVGAVGVVAADEASAAEPTFRVWIRGKETWSTAAKANAFCTTVNKQLAAVTSPVAPNEFHSRVAYSASGAPYYRARSIIHYWSGAKRIRDALIRLGYDAYTRSA